MELSAVFQSIVEQMEPQDILDTAWALVSDILQPATKTYAAAAAADVPAAEVYIQPQSIHLETAPLIFEQPFMPMHIQEKNLPVLQLPQGLGQNLIPVGIVNGEVVFALPEVTSFAPQSISISPKRKRTYHSQDEDQPYVKKPLNAFMLYLKDQRPNVVAELQCRNNAQVNAVLGQRWKSMSSKEQAKYYEEAERLRKLHSQQHPDWSSDQNYGKKRKRIRRKYHTSTERLSN